MSRFKVTVTEILSRDIFLDAESCEEATGKVDKAYRNSQIILGGDDFSTAEIHAMQISV